MSRSKETSMKILITQPKPASEKSPFFDLEKKYHVKLFFRPFIELEAISAREFRRQKIDIAQYSAVIFTSKNAIDHFFRTCDELKHSISQETKYFCITEAVALYLQKFILYRKRKVFYGADGTNKSLFDVINKHKENEKFIYPCSENQQDNDIVNWLKAHNCEFATPYMYRSISSDVKDLFAEHKFDLIYFMTPSGVKSLFDNVPNYKQGKAAICAWGTNTEKAAKDAGLKVKITTPSPEAPSILAALNIFLQKEGKPIEQES